MPTADRVPNTVAMRLARMDTSREFPRSPSRLLSWNRRWYCLRVKPENWVISFPVLKEATTSTTMGI